MQVENNAWNGGKPSMKRGRSQSPSGSRKRGPETYNSAPFANAAPPHFNRSLTGPTGASPRDWVTLTESLALQTPPGASPHAEESLYGAQEDMEMSQEVTMEQDPPAPHPFAQQLASASFQAHDPFQQSYPQYAEAPPPVPPSSPIPPHRLPPLYQNLAGSPYPNSSPNPTSSAMTRSTSNTSTDSGMSTEGFTDPRPRQHYSPPSPRRGPQFSMGYRADCEKCVARVPGHYSHLNGPELLHAPPPQPIAFHGY